VKIAGCLYYGTSLTGSTEMTGGIVGYYYTTYGSIAGQSTVNLSDNFYTFPDVSVKGVGKWKKSNIATQKKLNRKKFQLSPLLFFSLKAYCCFISSQP
jgi:hypothetical protein